MYFERLEDQISDLVSDIKSIQVLLSDVAVGELPAEQIYRVHAISRLADQISDTATTMGEELVEHKKN